MDIVILGAGVAGAAAAIGLAQRGHAVRMFERRERPGTLGAGVTLWPNASYVLEALGVLDDIAAVAGRPAAMRRIAATGEALGGVDIAAIDAAMQRPTYTVLRRELQRILLARAASLGVAIHHGRGGVAVGSDDAHAWAALSDGSRATAELVIGADGRMASVARRHVAGERGAIYQGFVNWVGIAASAAPLVDDPHAILDFWGVGARFGIVPIDARTVYWAGGQRASLDDANASSDALAELRAQFAGWPSPIARVLAASAPAAIRKLAVHDVDPLPIWHRGRVVVIGDAAHAPLPTSGQGACQALEDAWALAQQLAVDGRALDASLAALAAQRHAKTAMITQSGRQLAHNLFLLDAAACAQRDATARAGDPRATARAMAGLWSRGLDIARPAGP